MVQVLLPHSSGLFILSVSEGPGGVLAEPAALCPDERFTQINLITKAEELVLLLKMGIITNCDLCVFLQILGQEQSPRKFILKLYSGLYSMFGSRKET